MEVRARSAGVIPVRSTRAGWRVLVLRAYRNWDFPKGLVEPGEDPLTTARREAAEEAALTDLELRWGPLSCDTPVYARGKVATYFVGHTTTETIELPINPELGHPEHHEGRWVTLAEAEALLPPRLQGVMAWLRRVLSGEIRAV